MPWLTTTAPPVLVGPPFALAFLWLSLAVGRRLLRWLGARGGHPAERALAMLGLGLGALEFVPFSLGAAGILSVTTLRIAIAVVALLALPD
ncbi:MAG TPA: hypothetical protein VGQ57_13855, partial [Polyangiaceae bacterium]|nr:hypothetical protein [Polyangiaceae bacterium]